MDDSFSKQYRRALVTGGAGFIGSHLCEELLKDGLEVISIDDYSAGREENLLPLHAFSGFREVRCDITDFAKLLPHFAGVDIVFHQACSKMTVCLRDPRRDLAVNAEGAFNVLEAARHFKVKKFVHASTGSVYGEARCFPTDETHSLNPTSYYGVSKLAGEKYVRLFGEMHGMNVTILRYYHVYGPRQENSEVGGVVSIFGRKALHSEPITIFGDGNQLRTFTYVKDVVAINKLVSTKAEARGEAFNCSSGVKITIMELANEVRRLLGKPNLPIVFRDWKPGDIKKFDVDNSKLRGLGFEFRTTFEEGLKETLKSLEDYFAVPIRLAG